jgi:hypothetical protein
VPLRFPVRAAVRPLLGPVCTGNGGSRFFRNDTCFASASSVRSEPPARGTSRAYGTRFGRPRKVSEGEHFATAERMKADGHTARDMAKYLGVSRATLYRCLIAEKVA